MGRREGREKCSTYPEADQEK
eukprot:COSAG05_NODE_11557_length_507_cov_2.990196_1_plen_20_part_10